MNWKVGEIVRAEAAMDGKVMKSVTFRIVEILPIGVSATPEMAKEQQESATAFIKNMGKFLGWDSSLDKVLYFFNEKGEQLPPFGPFGITYRIHKINL